MSDVKRCPLHSGYRFKTQCRVTTCKFYSERTRSKCLGLDITFSAEDKPFSDGELLHYKFPKQELSVKEVSKIRKKSVDQVKNLIMLQHLVSALMGRYTEFEDFNYEPGKSDLVDNVLQSTPLCLKKLDFEIWMLPVLFDQDVTSKIVGPKFKLKEALKLTNKEFIALERAVRILDSGETLFNSVV